MTPRSLHSYCFDTPAQQHSTPATAATPCTAAAAVDELDRALCTWRTPASWRDRETNDKENELPASCPTPAAVPAGRTFVAVDEWSLALQEQLFSPYAANIGQHSEK